jgi:hypothetical protein
MNVYLLYGYSVVGSVLAECVAAHHYLRRHQRLPARYRKGSFYVVRAAIALGAGVLPVVFAVETASAAFALGVGAPLIINQLSRGTTER